MTTEEIVVQLLDQIYPQWRIELDMQATPARVARAYEELLHPEPFEFTVFENIEGYDQIVAVYNVPFASLCRHHLLPFHGLASVGYIPRDHYAGLSKLARAVDHFARDFQTQERLTQQIGTFLWQQLRPVGIAVVISATHTCMTIRGVRKPGAGAVTSFMKGAFLQNAQAREEFLHLAVKERI